MNILSTVDSHLGRFQLLTVVKSAAMIIQCLSPGEQMGTFLLGVYLVRELLGPRVACVQLR